MLKTTYMDTEPNENYTFIIQIANPTYNLFHIRTHNKGNN